ncbi:MAG TPA: magnesium transporter [Polyangiales bacterium]|nr:magnesium transporter [Polyangiales bacterium]
MSEPTEHTEHSDFARSLVRELIERHPIDAARALAGVEREAVAEIVFTQAPLSAAELLRRLNPDDAAGVLGQAAPDQASALVPHMEPTLVADLVSRLDDEQRAAVLERMPRALAKELDQILTFPPGSAGKLMDSRATRFLQSETVEEALERLRRVSDRRITDLMLVDVDGRLEAVVPLHIAAGAKLDTPLGTLAKGEPVFVQSTTPSEDVVELLEKHHLASLPVVDLDRVLIGVISYDALLKAAQQDAAADAQAMVGASRHERALSTPWEAIKSRLPWLQINLFTAFVASSVVGMFDETIAKVTALAVLMPMVAGQAGNTGAQALAVTQRGLALREIRGSHVWRMIRKEALVGASNGVAIALVTALGVFLWSHNAALAGVISVAMVVSMTIAAVCGSIIPIVLTALGRDPATASSILLSAVTDTMGFFSFLGLATLMLHALMPQ